ncbi:hypothetical protein [Bacillus sp. N6]|uniref:hypothetical protein n=1 Tax=Bacillus sp. N6 TaxID=127893 RepID=UPI0040573987
MKDYTMKGPSVVSLRVEVIYLGWELFKKKSIVDEHNENKEAVKKNENGKEIIAINILKSHFQLK